MLENKYRDRLLQQIDYYQALARSPATRPAQVRLYWTICRKIRQELALQG